MDPKYAEKLREMERRLLDQPGELDPAIRRGAAEGGPVPEDLSAYVEKVRRHAYKVSDEDVRGLLGAGWSEDQIFELTVATAYGAARRRLDAGIGAMAASDSPAALAEPGPVAQPAERRG